MQEQTQEQVTETQIPSPENPSDSSEPTPAGPQRDLNASDAVKIAKQMMKGENLLFEMELWRTLNELTAPRVSENQKLQLKKSLMRSLQFGLNFMAGGNEVKLQNFGPLSKRENNIARAIVKLNEYSTLVMADNLRQQEDADSQQGVKSLQELNTENKEEVN